MTSAENALARARQLAERWAALPPVSPAAITLGDAGREMLRRIAGNERPSRPDDEEAGRVLLERIVGDGEQAEGRQP